MLTSRKRFFSIPELIEQLASHLCQNDVSSLAQTCQSMYRTCTPAFYRTLTVKVYNGNSPFTSMLALEALARNVQHVRTLNFGVHELVFHFNCVQLSSVNVTSLTPRPNWLPRRDAFNPQMVPLPPFTLLAHLHVTFGSPRERHSYLPSARNPRATLAQLCWLLLLNPCLKSLHVDNLDVVDPRGRRLVCGALAGLPKLTRLHLRIRSRHEFWGELWSELFFSCPLSIQSLTVLLVMNVKHYPVQDPNRPQEGADEEFVTLVRRQEPLSNLEELTVDGVSNWLTTTNIRSIFSHCPNIKKLEVSAFTADGGIDDIGQFVGTVCPKIEWLKYNNPLPLRHDLLPFKLMESLPAKRMNMFMYGGINSIADNHRVGAAIQHHSITLRHIRIDSTARSQRMSVSVIFKECCNLEKLSINTKGGTGHYITLEDTLESPWTCTKLRRLALGISGCEVPIEPEVLPYYSRPTPITLSDAETLHFGQLERLYKQIGALISLQHLDLSMITFNEQGHAVVGQSDRLHTFPGWMTLQDSLTGRPGYLDLLSGLKQLECLDGSFRMYSVENKQMDRRAEVRWIDANWPCLRRAEFFSQRANVSTAFLWLMYKRKTVNQVDLKLWCV